MTNEDFLKRISLILDDGVDCFPNLIEHAKKLIAVAEAAKVIENYYWHYSEGDSVDIFKTALKDLERE